MNTLQWLIDRSWYKSIIKPKNSLIPIYESIVSQVNMPMELVIAHAHYESVGQNILAVGQAGEYGLWQFLPSTWQAIMGSADWRNVDNQAIAYVRHTQNIINRYGLNLHDPAHVEVYLWIWNAGGGAYDKGFMPASTREYIRVIKSYQAQVET